MFQSTPPREGRLFALHRFKHLRNSFNPRPRARGDTKLLWLINVKLMFQSTPPREGRQPSLSNSGKAKSVSIHAPARGATVDHDSWAVLKEFQSTPPREGRRDTQTTSALSIMFQSTPPREGRRITRLKCNKIYIVSIHAPARGATHSIRLGFEGYEFQSTPPREGRLIEQGVKVPL